MSLRWPVSRASRRAVGALVAVGTIVALGSRASAQQAMSDTPPNRQDRVRALEARSWEVRAARVTGAIRVDGRLDEPAWTTAEPVADFYQRERNEGLPATERTEVRVIYDDTNLYVGFRCFDREPERVRARAIFRDEGGSADDLVAIMIDAYHEHRGAIQFVSNANGLIEELFQTGETESTRNVNFDTVWFVRGRYIAEGFEVEFVIPFKSLRFEPPRPGEDAVFGIGFKRNIPRKNEEVYWPFVGNDSTWYRPAELGHLHGLRNIRPGRSLELRPYVLGSGARDFATNGVEGRGEAGGDVKWGVTTGLTADFTVNTDFAQEEADVQQINFTRFSLFFPEKRQFFLEGEQMFQFGLPEEVDLVFTRRIGLAPDGSVVPILAGARLSGRQGRSSLGAMNIQTRPAASLPGENFSVVRVRRDLFSRSSVGAVVTNRQGGGNRNSVVGADARFFFKRVWFLEGFLAAVDDDTDGRVRTTGYGRFAYESDRLGLGYVYLDVDDRFDPGVGFVRRPDSRQNRGEFRFSPRPRSDLVRQFHLRTAIDYVTDQRNVLETRERGAQFSADFESGDQAAVTYTNGLESISVPFRLRPGIEIPPGAYGSDTVQASVDTFRRRHTRANVSYTTGGYWGGTRNTMSLRGEWRPSTYLELTGSFDRNWVTLPQGRFATALSSARIQIAFRNDLALLSLFQYNTETRQVSSNIRFRWIPKPGSDFYVVYNELDLASGGLTPKTRSLVVKLTYLFSF